MVNGAVHVLGSDKAAIENAIGKTRQHAPLQRCRSSCRVAGDKMTVTVPAAKDEAAQAEVWLCPITGKVPVAIGRGENHGHTLTYTNVVRRWIKLGDWTGKAASFELPLAKDLPTASIDSAAVVVQSGAAAKR